MPGHHGSEYDDNKPSPKLNASFLAFTIVGHLFHQKLILEESKVERNSSLNNHERLKP